MSLSVTAELTSFGDSDVCERESPTFTCSDTLAVMRSVALRVDVCQYEIVIPSLYPSKQPAVTTPVLMGVYSKLAVQKSPPVYFSSSWYV